MWNYPLTLPALASFVAWLLTTHGKQIRAFFSRAVGGAASVRVAEIQAGATTEERRLDYNSAALQTFAARIATLEVEAREQGREKERASQLLAEEREEARNREHALRSELANWQLVVDVIEQQNPGATAGVQERLERMRKRKFN